MKRLMYGTVSALALLLTMHGGAKADATLATSVTQTDANAAAGVVIDATNAIDDASFFAAAGAFQVQQNNSINSSASQNAAIDARSLDDNNVSTGQTNTASSLNRDTRNHAVGVQILTLNRITNDSFDQAAGQFEVQQNQAINSTTGQNLATTALTDDDAHINTSQAGTASASNKTTRNTSEDTTITNTNRITDSFENAAGAFQVQQNASINSSTQQNLALSAIADPNGRVSVENQVSLADLDAKVKKNRSNDDEIENARNAVNPDSFANAAGAFQVQQNNSTDSAVTQNLAVSAVVAGSVDVDTQFAAADLRSRVTRNDARDDDVEATNHITGSFAGASGVFQVEQNNSINSAASQNAAVAAVTAADVGAVGSQISMASLDTSVTNNIAIDDLVATTNRISGSFTGAAGAFQVQQNNSINSAASQNMAVTAVVAGAVSAGSQASTAELDSAVTGNSAVGDAVLATNTITNGSFTRASGMFQVQQNNSINSAVSQNMAVTAITTH